MTPEERSQLIDQLDRSFTVMPNWVKATVKKRMEMTRGVRLPEELSRRVGKAITPNPEFWEWMMGWPIGSTALQPLAMDKFRQWRRLHGGF